MAKRSAYWKFSGGTRPPQTLHMGELDLWIPRACVDGVSTEEPKRADNRLTLVHGLPDRASKRDCLCFALSGLLELPVFQRSLRAEGRVRDVPLPALSACAVGHAGVGLAASR